MQFSDLSLIVSVSLSLLHGSVSRQGVFGMMSAQQVSTAQALWRGFTMRCPSCGTGKLFGRFLKVVDHCPACGEEFSHQRADDFPAYIVIFVVGHTIVPAALAIEVVMRRRRGFSS